MPSPTRTANPPSFLAKAGRWMLVGVLTLGLLLIVLRIHSSKRNTRFTARLQAVSAQRELARAATLPVAEAVSGRRSPLPTAAAETTSETITAAAAPSGETFATLAEQLPQYCTLPRPVGLWTGRPQTSGYHHIGGGVHASQYEIDRPAARVEPLLFIRVRQGLVGLDPLGQPLQDRSAPPITRLSPAAEFHAWLDRAAAAMIRERLVIGSFESRADADLFRNIRGGTLFWLVHLRAAREGDVETLDQLFRANEEIILQYQDPMIPPELNEDWGPRATRYLLAIAGSTNHPDTHRWVQHALDSLRIPDEVEKQKRHAAILRGIDLLIKQKIQEDIGLVGTDFRAHVLDGLPQHTFAAWVKPAYDRELEGFALELIDGVPDPRYARYIRIRALCATMAITPPDLTTFEELGKSSAQTARRAAAIEGKLMLALMKHTGSTTPLPAQWQDIQSTLTPQELADTAEFDFRLVEIPEGQVFVRPETMPKAMVGKGREAIRDYANPQRLIGRPRDLDNFALTPDERAELLRRFETVPATVALVHVVEDQWDREMRVLRWSVWTKEDSPLMFDARMLDR